MDAALAEKGTVDLPRSFAAPPDDGSPVSTASRVAAGANIPRLHFWIIVISLALYSCLATLDETIIAPALPAICFSFNMPLTSFISWVASACFVTMATFQPILSKLCDIIGSKRTFIGSLGVFILGTALGGASVSFEMMLVARLIQGVGIAGAIAVSMIIVVRLGGTDLLGLYIVLFGISTTTGAIAGAPLGGIITDQLNWRWCFFVSLPISAAALVLILIYLRVPLENVKWNNGDGSEDGMRYTWRDIDYVGTLTFSISAVLLMLATLWGGNTYPWLSAPVICCYVIGIVFAALFVYWELYRATDPFIPLSLFKVRNYVASLVLQLCLGAIMIVCIVYFIIYLQLVQLKTPMQTSLIILPFMVSAPVGGGLHGVLFTFRKWFRWPSIIAATLSVAGVGLCMLLGRFDNDVADAFLPVLMGLSMGVLGSTSFISSIVSIDMDHFAPAVGFIDFSRSIGGAIGMAIASAAASNASLNALGNNADGKLLQDLFKHGVADIMKDNRVTGDHLLLYQEAIKVGIRAAFISLFPLSAISIVAAVFMQHSEIESNSLSSAIFDRHKSNKSSKS
ncbi:MFS general substrate transporter [Ramicandelaber brevisporus]|nr:MFS general substrate transporter [Ramicandelaber brevisporus]